LEPAAAHAIARGAEGGLRDAESMLDQLVAFCGEKISESDVLNVFGFTSEQTVVDLTGRILRGETADAIDLLHQQSEGGKDMMRLMSDLIAYLRDLLVFKAKPDALKEDVDPDVQKSLAAHAELIAMDRLLDLIDQFAAAEGRMKWTPNKKLHFEVAIIRAIQSLGQATLDEVIRKLSELRDGGKARPAAQPAQPVAAGAHRGGEASAQKTGVNDPGYSKTASARIAESPPKYKAAEASANIDPVRVWQQLSAKIPQQKGFLRNSAAAAHVLGVEGRNFLLGFSPSEKAMMQILDTQANRKFLDGLLHEITGKDWSVRISVNEELPPKHAVSGYSRPEDFKDDPLIQEAIELFKAEIKS
jgi:DNA polymerase-3 subunit gamma/tau